MKKKTVDNSPEMLELMEVAQRIKQTRELLGYTYKNLASLFKNKISEPFWVKIPYSDADLEKPHYSQHQGQEMDIVIKGRMKAWIGDNCEILEPGDSIYYKGV